MLSLAKPILSQKLLVILQQAYMTQFEPNKLPEATKYDAEIRRRMQDDALKFAQAAADPTAEAIYNFIKEISINIIIPPSVIAPVTPALPGGPCSGTISPLNITIV